MNTPTLILSGDYKDHDGNQYNLAYDIWGTVSPVTDDTGAIVNVSVNTWSTVKGSGPNGPRFETD